MGTLKNMAVCDLRGILDIRKIEEIDLISDVAVLILPNHTSPQIYSALMATPKERIANTVSFGVNSKTEDMVKIHSGIINLHRSDFATRHETLVVLNGIAFVDYYNTDARATIVGNGIVIIHESMKFNSNLKIESLNGLRTYSEYNDCKGYMENLVIDADYLSYLKPKTAVAAIGQIKIAGDVTVEMLKEKVAILATIESIACSKNIAAYIKANSICMEETVIDGSIYGG